MKTSKSSAYPVVEGVSEKTYSNCVQADNRPKEGTIKPM